MYASKQQEEKVLEILREVMDLGKEEVDNENQLELGHISDDEYDITYLEIENGLKAYALELQTIIQQPMWDY